MTGRVLPPAMTGHALPPAMTGRALPAAMTGHALPPALEALCGHGRDHGRGGASDVAVIDTSSNTTNKKATADLPLESAEARDMWRFLDDLAQRDPEEYRRFISGQMREAQMPERAVHYAGLTVKCQRKASSTTGSTVPRNHYINVCQSKRVAEPDRKKLSGGAEAWRSMTIPMVLDDPRERRETPRLAATDDEQQAQRYIVYDMIVHPCVAEKALTDERFCEELVRVMVDGVRAEFGVELKRAWKLTRRYKGIFQWDEQGRRREGLPMDDEAQARVEADLKRREEIQRIVQGTSTVDGSGQEATALAAAKSENTHEDIKLTMDESRHLKPAPLITEIDEYRSSATMATTRTSMTTTSTPLADKRVPVYAWSRPESEDGGALIVDLRGETPSTIHTLHLSYNKDDLLLIGRSSVLCVPLPWAWLHRGNGKLRAEWHAPEQRLVVRIKMDGGKVDLCTENQDDEDEASACR